jgi:hypothetical protein
MEITVDRIIVVDRDLKAPKVRIVVGVFLRKILSIHVVEFMTSVAEQRQAVA